MEDALFNGQNGNDTVVSERNEEVTEEAMPNPWADTSNATSTPSATTNTNTTSTNNLSSNLYTMGGGKKPTTIYIPVQSSFPRIGSEFFKSTRQYFFSFFFFIFFFQKKKFHSPNFCKKTIF